MSIYPNDPNSENSRRLPLRTLIGDICMFSHVDQPIQQCGSAILPMFTAFHHVLQLFEYN
jgi:hypothetical protein